jgi:pyridoxal phosphate enzyme (YggS family)
VFVAVTTLADRLVEVEDRIAAALAKARRRRDEITLIAVTKVFPASVIREGYEAGLRDFGENYVQEFETKRPQLDDLRGARFHLIGHLQTNKARRAAELFQFIQTVDTGKLARKLNEAGHSLEVMLEVRLSGEPSKAGTVAESLPALIDHVRACRHLVLTGLMTIPPWSNDPETARPYFVRLRELARRFDLPCLSMGMSNDFEVAIEEGATHIRVGTALFGPRRRG